MLAAHSSSSSGTAAPRSSAPAPALLQQQHHHHQGPRRRPHHSARGGHGSPTLAPCQQQQQAPCAAAPLVVCFAHSAAGEQPGSSARPPAPQWTKWQPQRAASITPPPPALQPYSGPSTWASPPPPAATGALPRTGALSAPLLSWLKSHEPGAMPGCPTRCAIGRLRGARTLSGPARTLPWRACALLRAGCAGGAKASVGAGAAAEESSSQQLMSPDLVGKTANVRFHLKYKTSFGQAVKLIGSHPKLGAGAECAMSGGAQEHKRAGVQRQIVEQRHDELALLASCGQRASANGETKRGGELSRKQQQAAAGAGREAAGPGHVAGSGHTLPHRWRGCACRWARHSPPMPAASPRTGAARTCCCPVTVAGRRQLDAQGRRGAAVDQRRPVGGQRAAAGGQRVRVQVRAGGLGDQGGARVAVRLQRGAGGEQPLLRSLLCAPVTGRVRSCAATRQL